MIKKTTILFLLLSNLVYSKDFKFEWETRPSISSGFKVIFESKKSKCFITIYDSYLKDSLKSKMTKKDCDVLFKVLSEYRFETKTNRSSIPIKERHYYNLITLPNTSMCVIRGDTLSKSKLKNYEYRYDIERKEWYQESYYVKLHGDGIMYYGKYTDSIINKSFAIDGIFENMNSSDYDLQNLIYKFIKKYDNERKLKTVWRLIQPWT